ncbi:ATP-grasp domain-containing protein [Peribacillus saganii]|uniref:ATP-grasp domain-containing protein n=1 Tax=Peribacillus saganii TaxID=2303992 RepID=A0A372LP14_9BACI|nr:ATP-grasp domain-containing protein [Peribacillus saganii]RFU69463.1 ATP-grasp domain-containing protein [Peribacillus saganii]
MGEAAFPIQVLKEQPNVSIRPSHSITDIYGKDIAYTPKLYAEDYQHFSSDLLSLEALTGRELSAVGNVPVICHEGTATEPALALLRKAGLHVPPIRYTYRNDIEYIEVLKDLAEQSKKLIFQYPHPAEKVSPDVSWVDPQLLAYLCDKRSIPELVPHDHVPPRRMMSLKQILEEKPALPIVLKTGDGRPTSGGCGVLLVEDERQLHEIDESFGDLSKIIVEEFIHYDQNISVHFAVNEQGVISFLGKSIQLVNKDGCFRGSWITVDIDDTIADIVDTGYEVMRNIAAKGYVGIAGFDVLIRGDQYYFIDLNVRFNGSTCGLLLYKDIRKNYGKEIVRLCNLEWNHHFDSLIPIVEKYMEKEQFIPLSLLDASYFPAEKQVSKVIGLVIGHSAPEVESVLMEITKDGLLLRE